MVGKSDSFCECEIRRKRQLTGVKKSLALLLLLLRGDSGFYCCYYNGAKEVEELNNKSENFPPIRTGQ